MALKLMDLRRYAIDSRVEVTFGDSASGRSCLINARGQAQIPGEDKDFRVDQLLEAADIFDVTIDGKARRLTGEEMADVIAQWLKKKGAPAPKEED